MLLQVILAVIPIAWLIISMTAFKMSGFNACGIGLIITAVECIAVYGLSLIHIWEYIYIQKFTRRIQDWNCLPEAYDVCRFYGGDLQGVMAVSYTHLKAVKTLANCIKTHLKKNHVC